MTLCHVTFENIYMDDVTASRLAWLGYYCCVDFNADLYTKFDIQLPTDKCINFVMIILHKLHGKQATLCDKCLYISTVTYAITKECKLSMMIYSGTYVYISLKLILRWHIKIIKWTKFNVSFLCINVPNIT